MHLTKGRCSGVSVVAFGCSGRRLSRGVAQKVERWSADGKWTGKYDAEGDCDCDAEGGGLDW